MFMVLLNLFDIMQILHFICHIKNIFFVKKLSPSFRIFPLFTKYPYLPLHLKSENWGQNDIMRSFFFLFFKKRTRLVSFFFNIETNCSNLVLDNWWGHVSCVSPRTNNNSSRRNMKKNSCIHWKINQFPTLKMSFKWLLMVFEDLFSLIHVNDSFIERNRNFFWFY